MRAYHTLVIGAGPAGLATSRELARRGINHLVLERGARVGHTWANLYEGLVLHTGKHLSALPGMRFPSSTPLFPTRADFLNYLGRYAATFDLPVETGADVRSIVRDGNQWHVRTGSDGELRSTALVIATGIVSNPFRPDMPHADGFRGRILHSVEYRRPEPYTGQRVLVVGAGNSAAEISVELARAGAAVSVAVRSGARVVPRQLAGIPIQYVAAPMSRLPRRVQRRITGGFAKIVERIRGPAVLPPPPDTKCPDVPLIGLQFVDAVRVGTIQIKPGVAEFTPRGTRFVDGSEALFDCVILATGYRAALAALGTLVRQDDCGFALRRSRIASADHPDLFFVGHNYDVRGALRNIALDARDVARAVEINLRRSPQHGTRGI